MSARRRRTPQRCLATGFTVLALGLGGCHHQITTRDGSCLHGCIQCADANTLYVAADEKGGACPDYTGGVYVVPRQQVLEIKHPGPVALAAGGGVMVFVGAGISISGLVAFSVGDTSQDPAAVSDASAGVLLPLLIFLPAGVLTAGGSVAMTFGLRNLVRAREAVEARGPSCKRQQKKSMERAP